MSQIYLESQIYRSVTDIPKYHIYTVVSHIYRNVTGIPRG